MKKFQSNAERDVFFLGRQLLNLDAELSGAGQQKRLALFQEAVTVTLNSLRSLPGFEGGKVLEELLLDLADVAAGNSALQPVPKSGRPKQGWRDARLQGHSAAVVELLISKGENEAAACQFVAKILTDNGHKGRRSDSISASTVRAWRSQASAHGDKLVAHLMKAQALLALERLLPPQCDLALARKALVPIVAVLVPSSRLSD